MPRHTDWGVPKKKRQKRQCTELRHHLDRRTGMILSGLAGADDDDLLDTPELATALGVSEQWLEIGRCRGYGPDYVKLGPRLVRYRVGTVRKYLHERTHRVTAA